MTDWKESILRGMPVHRLENGIVVGPTILDPDAGYWDIDYEGILKDPYRTVSAEHPYYVAAVRDAVERIAGVADPVVADLGCGDGRFVRLLQQLGCSRVVGMDISRMNLQRLARRVEENAWASNVLLVEGDMREPPFPAASFDLVMAVGVLLVLGDGFAQGVAAASGLVRPGGYLLTVDPTDFGAAMYGIARHDMKETGKVLRQRTKTVEIAREDAPRYSVRSADEMKSAHVAAGMEVVWMRGIPLFPSLLFGAVKQLTTREPGDLEEMKQLCDMLNSRYPDCWRAACVLSRKPR